MKNWDIPQYDEFRFPEDLEKAFCGGDEKSRAFPVNDIQILRRQLKSWTSLYRDRIACIMGDLRGGDEALLSARRNIVELFELEGMRHAICRQTDLKDPAFTLEEEGFHKMVEGGQKGLVMKALVEIAARATLPGETREMILKRMVLVGACMAKGRPVPQMDAKTIVRAPDAPRKVREPSLLNVTRDSFGHPVIERKWEGRASA